MSIEEGDAKARELGVMFVETSAKAGFNIKVGFSQLILQFSKAHLGLATSVMYQCTL